MIERRIKSWQEVAEQDLLSWEDVVIYVRGAGRVALMKARRGNLLPQPRLRGKWSRYDIDAWMGKHQVVLPYRDSEPLHFFPAAF